MKTGSVIVLGKNSSRAVLKARTVMNTNRLCKNNTQHQNDGCTQMPAQGEGQVKSQQGAQSSDDSSPQKRWDGLLVSRYTVAAGPTSSPSVRNAPTACREETSTRMIRVKMP